MKRGTFFLNADALKLAPEMALDYQQATYFSFGLLTGMLSMPGFCQSFVEIKFTTKCFDFDKLANSYRKIFQWNFSNQLYTKYGQIKASFHPNV